MTPEQRWRLLLGEVSEPHLGGLDAQSRRVERAVSWLYGREPGGGGGGDRLGERSAGLEGSQLGTPEWINEVHELFPRDGIERLERDAVELYQIDDLVTRADVLERIEPNETLLRAVLRTKHLMNPDVLALARRLVEAVVRDLLERFRTEIRTGLSGVRDRRRHTNLAAAANLDLHTTLRRNLQHYDPETRSVTVERAYFNARVKRHTEQWQLIMAVDQSGSMLDSVIHSAVTAACLWGVPGLRTHLIAFDTAVVDLTSDVDDPVELLMKVQLGGGTDIASAVRYAAQLVDAPRRTIVVIISDFFEGGSPGALVAEVAGLVRSGCVVLGLAALDSEARPCYDRALAQALVDVGADVGAMTPGELAGFVARHVRG
ncbi:MAG: VWA domain-containing protein [Acidimicrobiia bacterium]|nr:VWA domain-containing protein [Acidimicrobiia bacterium]